MLLREGRSVSEIAGALDLTKATVCFHKRRLGYAMQEPYARRYDWDAIRRYYEEGHSLSECQERFGFSKGAWSDAVRRGDVKPRPRATPLEQVLVKGRKFNRWHLQRRLVAEGLKEPRCERCGISEWLGRPLPLELHHVNGDGLDNRLENVRLLCSNCHSQTDNWGGAARRKAA